jgi:hypothetical protein
VGVDFYTVASLSLYGGVIMHKAFKSPFFYIPVALVVIIIAVIGTQFIPNGRTPAILHITSGTVQVDQGTGYTTAIEGMELDEGAKIRTAASTGAYVVLYEGVIVRLEENTEITISELSKNSQDIAQSTGSTWSKIARLGGVESYSVQTPTTTATVRGTSFSVGGALLVIEGVVEVDEAGFKGKVHAGEKLFNGTVTNFTAEDIILVREQLNFELRVLRELRLREVYKDDMAIYVARTTYDATDEDIEKFFLDLDEGHNSEEDIKSHAKVITPTMKRVFAYDAEIQKTLATIKAYS